MPNRKSIRLKNWDYTKEGYYFVTICTFKNKCILGEIINGKMIENECGQIVRDEWLKTPKIRSNIILDAFIIMPNHIHGIIIMRATHQVADTGDPPEIRTGDPMGRPYTSRTIQSGSLGAIIGQFKSVTTKLINSKRTGDCMGDPAEIRTGDPAGRPYQLPDGSPSYENFKWHRSFYDHIIRNEQSLNEIRNYINNNPTQWSLDKYYSFASKLKPKTPIGFVLPPLGN